MFTNLQMRNKVKQSIENDKCNNCNWYKNKKELFGIL